MYVRMELETRLSAQGNLMDVEKEKERQTDEWEEDPQVELAAKRIEES